MFCEKCGKPMKDGAKFCAFCGQKVLPDDDFEQNQDVQQKLNQSYSQHSQQSLNQPYHQGLQSNVSQNGYQQPPQDDDSKKKKGILITCIIVGVVLIAALITAVVLVIGNKDICRISFGRSEISGSVGL